MGLVTVSIYVKIYFRDLEIAVVCVESILFIKPRSYLFRSMIVLIRFLLMIPMLFQFPLNNYHDIVFLNL